MLVEGDTAQYELQYTGASEASRFLKSFLGNHLEILVENDTTRRHFVAIIERLAAAGSCDAHELVRGLESLYR